MSLGYVRAGREKFSEAEQVEGQVRRKMQQHVLTDESSISINFRLVPMAGPTRREAREECIERDGCGGSEETFHTPSAHKSEPVRGERHVRRGRKGFVIAARNLLLSLRLSHKPRTFPRRAQRGNVTVKDGS